MSKPKYRSAPEALLSGVAECECGSPLHFHWMVKADRNQEYRYYRCAGRSKYKTGCVVGAIQAEELEALTEDSLMMLIGDLEVLERVLIPGEDHSKELEDVERAIREITEDRAAGLFRGERGAEEYRAMRTRLEDRREELEKLPNVPDRWEFVPTGRTYRSTWVAMDTPEERRNFLRGSGLRVVLHAEPVKTRPLFAGLPPNDGGRVSFEIPTDLRQRVEERVRRLAR